MRTGLVEKVMYTDAKDYAKDIVNTIVPELVNWCIEVSDVPPSTPDRLPPYLQQDLDRAMEVVGYGSCTPSDVQAIIANYSHLEHGMDVPVKVYNLQTYKLAGAQIAYQMMMAAVRLEIVRIFDGFNAIDFDFDNEVDENGYFIPENEREQVLKEWFEHELILVLEDY